MRTMIKTVLSWIVCTCLIVSCPSSALAYDSSISDEALNVAQVNIADTNASITNISFVLSQKELEMEENISGKFYPLTSGIYKDKILVGEFTSDNSNIEINRIQIGTNTEISALGNEEAISGENILTIEMIDKKTGEQYSSRTLVSEDTFSSLLEVAYENRNAFLEDGNSEEDYTDLLIQLSLGENVTPHRGEVSSDTSAHLRKTVSNSSKSELSDFSYSELTNMLRDITTDQRINLADYNIAPAFFASPTDESLIDENASLYMVSKSTESAGSGVYYTFITFMDLIVNKTATNVLSYQTSIKYSVMIEYANTAPTASLYLNNAGLKIDNVRMMLALTDKENSRIFTSMEKTGNVSSTKIDVSSLIGLSKKTEYQVVAALWNTLQIETTGPFNGGKYLLDDSIAAQEKRWGKIVRAISLDSESVYIRSTAQRMVLTGETTGVTGYGWKVSYEWSNF